jgi:hypothetical protein
LIVYLVFLSLGDNKDCVLIYPNFELERPISGTCHLSLSNT